MHTLYMITELYDYTQSCFGVFDDFFRIQTQRNSIKFCVKTVITYCAENLAENFGVYKWYIRFQDSLESNTLLRNAT